MSTRMEIHPGDGGADAEVFAAELGDAVARHAGAAAQTDGRIVVLDRL